MGIRRTGKPPMRLDAATATAARPSGTIMRNRGHILYSSDPETLTRQHPNRGLRTRTRSPGLVATRSPDTNMERSDPLILSHFRSGRGGLHGRIGSTLETVSLNMLPTGTPRNSLGTRQISDVNHSIVEAGVDVRYPPVVYLLGLVNLLRHDTNYPEEPGSYQANLNHLLSTRRLRDKMTPVPAWRHSFQTLGFAFIVIGAILTMIGTVTVITLTNPINCPAGGCIYYPALAITASLLPSGLTLVIAGIVVIRMVKVESEREDRES